MHFRFCSRRPEVSRELGRKRLANSGIAHPPNQHIPDDAALRLALAEGATAFSFLIDAKSTRGNAETAEELQNGLSHRAAIAHQSIVFIGSPTRARTWDLRINSPSLYRLSYRGPGDARRSCCIDGAIRILTSFNAPAGAPD